MTWIINLHIATQLMLVANVGSSSCDTVLLHTNRSSGGMFRPNDLAAPCASGRIGRSSRANSPFDSGALAQTARAAHHEFDVFIEAI
jgi:hypothetical protein